jgi:hypothetical protein
VNWRASWTVQGIAFARCRRYATSVNGLRSNAACEEQFMTNHSLPILATVALTVDLPDENLTRGQLGTVVEHLQSDDELADLVEFDDENGDTYAVVAVRPEHLLVLHRQCRHARAKLAYA